MCEKRLLRPTGYRVKEIVMQSRNCKHRIRRVLNATLIFFYLSFFSVAMADSNLPFTGRVNFMFTNGNFNAYVASIDKLGNTKITTGGVKSPSVVYKGIYQKRIKILNPFNSVVPGKYLLLELTEKTASFVDNKGNIIYSEDCSENGDSRLACLAPLYKF